MQTITCPKCGEKVSLKKTCEACGADLRELVKEAEEKERLRAEKRKQEEERLRTEKRKQEEEECRKAEIQTYNEDIEKLIKQLSSVLDIGITKTGEDKAQKIYEQATKFPKSRHDTGQYAKLKEKIDLYFKQDYFNRYTKPTIIDVIRTILSILIGFFFFHQIFILRNIHIIWGSVFTGIVFGVLLGIVSLIYSPRLRRLGELFALSLWSGSFGILVGGTAWFLEFIMFNISMGLWIVAMLCIIAFLFDTSWLRGSMESSESKKIITRVIRGLLSILIYFFFFYRIFVLQNIPIIWGTAFALFILVETYGIIDVITAIHGLTRIDALIGYPLGFGFFGIIVGVVAWLLGLILVNIGMGLWIIVMLIVCFCELVV
jgi:uncharacterized FlaG/YvyC family protein